MDRLLAERLPAPAPSPRARRAGLAVALAVALCGAQGRAQSTPPQATPESRERRYRELLERADRTAAELYRVGEWCLRTSTELSGAERARYRDRGAACFRRAEARVRDELVRIFAEAESSIHRSADYREVLSIQRAARDDATEYLEPLLSIFEFQKSLESFRQVIEQGAERLEAVALPFRRREAERRVQGGEVFVEGRWEAADREDPRVQFAGTVPFSVLRRKAGDYLGQLVCTNFLGRGKVHELLGIPFLDGFDDRGEYIPPHFMPERTVLTLREDESSWLKSLEYLRENERGRSSRQGFRFQVVVRVHERSLQETPFFDAQVQQMAVFDENNRLIEYLGPQPGESE